MKKVCIVCLTILFTSSFAIGQACNSIQTLTIPQQSQLNSWVDDLDTALKYEILYSIDSINAVMKGIYSSEAGEPEVMENYVLLDADTSWIDLPNTILLSRTLVDANATVYTDLWKLAKGMAPPAYDPHSIFLRTAAEYAAGLFKIADKETDLGRKALYQSWAIQAMDSLATMQLPNGAFPFPDLRTYGDPNFSSIIQNFMISCGADSVNVLQNGWIVDDKGTGEFKFDAGVICNSYYIAYQYTGNVQYRNIALSIADYLKPLKFNRNYNYNSFVALGLGRAYQLNNDTSYLYRGVKNMRYAMYPGQLANGRWADGHNAKSVYHSIMIQNTALYQPLYGIGETYYSEIDSMIRNSIINMVNYTFNCEASSGFKWLIRTYDTDIPYINNGLSDSIHQLIGKHIHKAANDGSYMDVPTMGDYMELLYNMEHLGTEDMDEPLLLKLCPNPATNILYITPIPETPSIKIKILDIYGKTCLSIDHFIGANNPINIENLSNGVYFVYVAANNCNITYKLIKQ